MCSLPRDVSNLNPYAQGILDQINEVCAFVLYITYISNAP